MGVIAIGIKVQGIYLVGLVLMPSWMILNSQSKVLLLFRFYMSFSISKAMN